MCNLLSKNIRRVTLRQFGGLIPQTRTRTFLLIILWSILTMSQRELIYRSADRSTSCNSIPNLRASCETRTRNLRITSALLYQLKLRKHVFKLCLSELHISIQHRLKPCQIGCMCRIVFYVLSGKMVPCTTFRSFPYTLLLQQ